MPRTLISTFVKCEAFRQLAPQLTVLGDTGTTVFMIEQHSTGVTKRHSDELSLTTLVRTFSR